VRVCGWLVFGLVGACWLVCLGVVWWSSGGLLWWCVLVVARSVLRCVLVGRVASYHLWYYIYKDTRAPDTDFTALCAVALLEPVCVRSPFANGGSLFAFEDASQGTFHRLRT
jgi:hypothetical protein